MSQHIDALYVNGVFRPEQPVDIADGERVALTVDLKSPAANDLSDVLDLLDTEFIESCRRKSGNAPSLAAVREILAAYHGALSDLICEERDER